jgi:hypothetical protein
MFALRDELFDDASEGQIAFDSAAYGILRKTMNGGIRFAHRMNLPFALSLVMIDASVEGYTAESMNSQLEAAKKGLTSVQCRLIDDYKLRMNYLMVEYLTLNSLVFVVGALTIIVPIAFVYSARRHATKIVGFARRPLEHIDSAAYLAADV